MFSERTTPISELVKGTPDRPMREPALVILACIFNGFQIYQLAQVLPQLAVWNPLGEFFGAILAGVIPGLIMWYVAFSAILLIGAGLVYFVNRRIGGALILIISIVGLLIGFVGIVVTVFYSVNTLSLITGLLAPLFGLVAGFYGIRSEKPATTQDFQEIV